MTSLSKEDLRKLLLIGQTVNETIFKNNIKKVEVPSWVLRWVSMFTVGSITEIAKCKDHSMNDFVESLKKATDVDDMMEFGLLLLGQILTSVTAVDNQRSVKSA